MTIYNDRIYEMALEALGRYNQEVLAGGRPRYPAWVCPILARRRPPLTVHAAGTLVAARMNRASAGPD